MSAKFIYFLYPTTGTCDILHEKIWTSDNELCMIYFPLELLSPYQIYSLLCRLHTIGYCSQSWVLLGKIPWLRLCFQSHTMSINYIFFQKILILVLAPAISFSYIRSITFVSGVSTNSWLYLRYKLSRKRHVRSPMFNATLYLVWSVRLP